MLVDEGRRGRLITYVATLLGLALAAGALVMVRLFVPELPFFWGFVFVFTLLGVRGVVAAGMVFHRARARGQRW